MLFAIPQKLYKITKRLKTKEEVEAYFPGFLALVDCTEEPIHTKTKEQEKKKTVLFRQEKETLGKESVHSKSEGPDNLLIQTQKDRKLGMMHDYRIYKKNHPDIPKNVMGMYDLGFLGVEKDYRIKNHYCLSKRGKAAR